jgi:hypothetical protein
MWKLFLALVATSRKILGAGDFGGAGGISLDRFDVINFTTRNLFLRVVVFDKKVNKTWVFGYSIWSAQEEDREELLTELENVCSNQAAPLLIGAILIC